MFRFETRHDCSSPVSGVILNENLNRATKRRGTAIDAVLETVRGGCLMVREGKVPRFLPKDQNWTAFEVAVLLSKIQILFFGFEIRDWRSAVVVWLARL